jgi:Family of unknown function (DUF5670)
MLWLLVVILLIAWLLGWQVLSLGSLVHVILLIVVILVVYSLVTGRRVD